MQTVQKENANRKAAIPQLDHKRNENAAAYDGRLNFPGANKFITAEVRKVEVEPAASL